MRKVKKVFAALLLLFVTNTLMAQSETYTLKGSLKDANDGATIPYTNCVLLHSTDSVFVYGVTSDDKGAFCFKGIEGGFYLLRISCVGYETHWQPVDIHAEKSIGTIKLSPISTSLNEIQITASRPSIPPMAKRRFTMWMTTQVFRRVRLRMPCRMHRAWK